MCTIVWGLFKHAALLVRTLCLLLLAIPLSLFFGFWGAIDELFGGIDVRQNTTLALEHGVQVLKNSYVNGTYPDNFFLWGSIAAGVYGCLVLLYYLLSCFGIFHACSKELEGYATETLKRHRRRGRAHRHEEDNDSDDMELELQQLRRETESFRDRYSVVLDLDDNG